jgi:hypothetical protein
MKRSTWVNVTLPRAIKSGAAIFPTYNNVPELWPEAMMHYIVGKPQGKVIFPQFPLF